MKINIYDFLINNEIAYVRMDKLFRERIKEKIIQKYGSIKKYNSQELKICYGTLKLELNKNKYFKFNRLLKITENIGIPKEEVFNHIEAFFAKGSRTGREVILPKELIIDEQFIEGYTLYIAEGDKGSNERTKSRKLRFSTTEFPVLKYFQNWLVKYFPNNNYYFKVLIPHDKVFTEYQFNYIKIYFNLDNSQIKIQECKNWKKKRYNFLYRICCDRAILIDLFFSLDKTIKNICLNDEKLAAAYIRGMMVGEGTAYFKESRYVRIEMRNEKEIKYLHKLFRMLDFACEPYLRTERENMWSIYIGAKQLKKFYDEIGFGVHQARQRILEAAVNKKLRVNQYV